MLRATLASLALVVGLFAGSAAPAQARSAAGHYATQAHHATNHQRAQHDRSQLRKKKCVQHAAVRQAKRMAHRRRMFHQDLGRVLRDCHLVRAGENVAYGYPSGRAVVNQGWMHSQGHRANILNPSFRLMGIGARKGSNGRWYVAQVFGSKR